MKPLHLHVTLAAFNHMSMNGSRLTVMLFAASPGASSALIGLLAALYGVFGAMVAERVGRWINRAGLRKPIMLASGTVTHDDYGAIRKRLTFIPVMFSIRGSHPPHRRIGTG